MRKEAGDTKCELKLYPNNRGEVQLAKLDKKTFNTSNYTTLFSLQRAVKSIVLWHKLLVE